MEVIERNEDTLLLCTIINDSPYFLRNTLDRISSNFKINNNKIFVLKSQTNDETKLILTYNILKKCNPIYKDVLRSTFQVHRKKEFNVLYTLNSLNNIVKQKNDGKQDTNFKIDWSEYKNSLLIVRDDKELHIMPTILYDIVDL